MSPPQKPNLDLIDMVQRARMKHDAEATPSQVDAVYWIEAKSNAPDTHPPTPRAGQWVIETTVQQVDALWATIKTATEAGQLGYKSKVCTVSQSPQNRESRIICVRTYDNADLDDVTRIHDALRALGIDGALAYEAD